MPVNSCVRIEWKDIFLNGAIVKRTEDVPIRIEIKSLDNPSLLNNSFVAFSFKTNTLTNTRDTTVGDLVFESQKVNELVLTTKLDAETDYWDIPIDCEMFSVEYTIRLVTPDQCDMCVGAGNFYIKTEMTYSEFYRTKGAKDKQPRKRRKKTRIETAVQKKIDKAKRPFEADPGVLGRAIEYVKENPGKAFMTALGTTALVATQGKRIAKGLEGIVGADISTVIQKNKRYQQLVESISKMKEKIALGGYKARKAIDLDYAKQMAAEQERIAKAEAIRAQAAEVFANLNKQVAPESTEQIEKAAKRMAKGVSKTKTKKRKSGDRYNAPKSGNILSPTSASKPLPKKQGGAKTGSVTSNVTYRPRKKTGPKGSRVSEDFTFSPVPLAYFARTPGAKDKRKRKPRRKTRIEASVERKINTAKRMFEPEPTKFEKVVDYVKRNPLKALGAVGGTLYGAHLMKGRIKELIRDYKYGRDIIKNIGEVRKGGGGSIEIEVDPNYSSSNLISEFARTRGARDKRKRKKRYRRGTRVRAIDKDKLDHIGESEVIQDSGSKSEIDPKVKEAYLRAQTFRSRMNPIIYGIREARSTANMLGRMSRWSKGGNANFYANEGMPVIEDIIGKQIRGRGGIVKILAHIIGSDKTYALDYKPKEYDSSNRYYERYATLLADPQSNLHKAKDVGGKPDREKSQVKGQQGIEAKKGKVSGSMLSRQYSSTYNGANFEEEGRIAKLRKRFRKMASQGKEYAGKKYRQGKGYVKEKAPKVKAYAGRKYQQAKEGIKKAELGRKAGTAALKTAYHTGRYAEKAAQAKRRMLGD